jgi:flagellar motor switch protein FliM
MRARKMSAASVLADAPQRLLEAAGVAVERMPMLHVVFDKMAAQCCDSVRPLSSAPAIFSADSIATERIGDVLDACESGVVFGIFHAAAWDQRILIGLPHDLVLTLTEAMFGGDGSEAACNERRPLSGIETRVAQRLFELLGAALRASFATVSETRLVLERVETRLDFAVIAPRNTYAVVARLKLRILGRERNLFVLVPQAALSPLRQDLARDRSSELAARDPRWTRQMETEVGRTEVVVQGVIEERQFTLEDILGLRIGMVLPLQATASSPVMLEGNAEPLFWCRLGQADGHYTLRVEAPIEQVRDLAERGLQ